LKIERRAKAQRNPSSRQRKVESADSGHGPLFEFHSAKRSKTVTNDDKSAVAERPDTTK
jgi:hypothetical protein